MYIHSSSAEDIISEVDKRNPGPNEIIMICLGEKKLPKLEILVEKLNQKKVRFFGGIFPGLLYGENRYEEGAIISTFKTGCEPLLVTGLNYSNIKILDSGNGSVAGKMLKKNRTAIVLVDGLSKIFHYS